MQRRPGREAPGRGARIVRPSPGGILLAFDGGTQDLGGRQLLSWSLDVLRAGGCRPLAVAFGPEGPDPGAAVPPGVVVVAGSRRASLLDALDQIEGDRVVLHDAGRPFADPELVGAVAGALDAADVAIAAVPIGETLKLVEGNWVATTVDRRHLWHPQTPQAYRRGILRRALEQAPDDVHETEAARRLGAHIVIVPGSGRNIRVTTGDDLELAEAIARAR